MNKDELLKQLQGAGIADIILEGDSLQAPFRIKTIILVDGHHLEMVTGERTHPAYKQELAEFTEKVEQTTYNSSFSYRPKYLGLEEMRKIAADHAKKINANGGNVGSNFRDDCLVRIGEDLATLRR
jgi:hypothetical protein